MLTDEPESVYPKLYCFFDYEHDRRGWRSVPENGAVLPVPPRRFHAALPQAQPGRIHVLRDQTEIRQQCPQPNRYGHVERSPMQACVPQPVLRHQVADRIGNRARVLEQ